MLLVCDYVSSKTIGLEKEAVKQIIYGALAGQWSRTKNKSNSCSKINIFDV